MLKSEPRLATAREYIVQVHCARAEALDVLQRYDDAVQDWDRAIELSDGLNKTGFERCRAESLNRAAKRPVPNP